MNTSVTGTLSASALLALSLLISPMAAQAEVAISYYSGTSHSHSHRHRHTPYYGNRIIYHQTPYYGFGSYKPRHIDKRYRSRKFYDHSHDRHRGYRCGGDNYRHRKHIGESRFDDYRSRRFRYYAD